MNAAVAEVMSMVVEDRTARPESDVTKIKGDPKTANAEVLDFGTDVAKEFGSVIAELRDFRTEVAKEFASLRAELRDFKTEVAKEFGSLRAELRSSMESLRTSIEHTKVWMLGTGISTVLGVAAIVGLKVH
jgi:predicted RNase H-like nuclease (RuvC/YqgF family)